jgi:hypothetical protein
METCLEEAVKASIKALKSRKAPGVDITTADMIQSRRWRLYSVKVMHITV